MTLKFESLSLKNFGPYREINDLDLTTTPESPIVVIHGENTLGKTRLFRALRWGLYGAPEADRNLPAQGLNDYMNRPALADGESEMHVAIKFVANEQHYSLTRRARFEHGAPPRVSADLRIDSQVIQQASIEAEIARQLHPKISDFFLFDGELLRDFYDRLNSESGRDLLRESIEAVLGIPALQLAASDIRVMTDDVLQRQAKTLKNQKNAEAARRQLRDLKSRQESLDKDRSEIEDALRRARASLEEVKENIASVEDLKADAREMEMLESQIRGSEREIQSVREDMSKLLTRGWLAPASAKLSAALAVVTQANDAAQNKQKVIQDARDRVEFLRTQIQGGVCPACHQNLPAPDEDTKVRFAEAEAELQRLIGESGDGPDLQRERKIRSLIDTTTVDAYRERQKRLNALVAAQYDRTRRLNTIKDRMKDNDAARIRQLATEQETLERVVKGYISKLRDFDDKQVQINSAQNKLANSLRRLGGTQPALAAEAFFFEYVQALIGRTIERYRERTRAEVEQSATAMLMKLIRDPEGYDGIQISRDYRVDLVGKHGPAMQTSEGGRQLIALSLIGALKHAAVRGGPVVLDSPLARLDLEHRENVLRRWVPELGSQAILLVQSGELTDREAQDIMGKRISQAYRIVRPHNDPEEATIERTQ